MFPFGDKTFRFNEIVTWIEIPKIGDFDLTLTSMETTEVIN